MATRNRRAVKMEYLTSEEVTPYAAELEREHGYSMGEARGFIGAAMIDGSYRNECFEIRFEDRMIRTQHFHYRASCPGRSE